MHSSSLAQPNNETPAPIAAANDRRRETPAFIATTS
jgi:hypothetical protein